MHDTARQVGRPPVAGRPAASSRSAGRQWQVPAASGRSRPGERQYYRMQGDDLLIEYDTTGDGNHAHTVLRRPRGDFGDDVLAAHYRQAHR